MPLRPDEHPTLLLDEADNHIGFAAQSVLWRDLFGKLSKKYQLIVSTHSLFPVLLKRDNLLRRDNIIVLAEKYAEICVWELRKAVKYFNAINSGENSSRRVDSI